MMIDDTWPQAGEMRSLWKGTTEFWTNDMPQDDTWEPNRHHSHILPLFNSHLARDTAAMFPLLQKTVTSTEHECRDLHLPAVSHTENAEEEGGCVVLGLPELSNVHSNHHDDSSGATESRRQGRNHGSQQVPYSGVGVRRGGVTFQPEGGGTHRTGSIARRGQLSQEVAGRSPFGGTICPAQSDRNSIPTGTGDGEDVPDHETVGGEVGASRSMKTGQKKTLAEWHQKGKDPMGKMSRNCQGGGEKPQSKKNVLMCILFRGTLLLTCEEVPSCSTPVFWWHLWHIRKTHISVYGYSMQPGFRSFEVHTYCYGY